jgi:hypothetical protein
MASAPPKYRLTVAPGNVSRHVGVGPTVIARDAQRILAVATGVCDV